MRLLMCFVTWVLTLSPLRPSLVQANDTETIPTTEPAPILLYNQSTVLADEFTGRLIVTPKAVTLHSVRMTDEGSYTVKDWTGKPRRRNCLDVRGEGVWAEPRSMSHPQYH